MNLNKGGKIFVWACQSSSFVAKHFWTAMTWVDDFPKRSELNPLFWNLYSPAWYIFSTLATASVLHLLHSGMYEYRIYIFSYRVFTILILGLQLRIIKIVWLLFNLQLFWEYTLYIFFLWTVCEQSKHWYDSVLHWNHPKNISMSCLGVGWRRGNWQC